MKPTYHPLTKDEAGMLIAFSALILGGWARIFTVLGTDFPINDGGLFYKMVQVVQANQYSLPDYIHYNGLKIPFAYPPLAFYLSAVLSDFFNVPLMEIFHFLPAIVLVGTIPAFYELAKTILEDRFQAGIATLIFAFTPRSITWFIMGGGITRSIGLLFLLIAIRYVHLALSISSRKYTILAILFCSLVVLTHPEAALHMIGIGVLIWFFKGRSRKGTATTFLIGAGTIILTAIWWLPLLLRFGPEPILSASQTGLNSFGMNFIFSLVQFDEEPYITFIMVLAFLGMVTEIASAGFFIPSLYFMPFMIELRSAPNVAIIPLALLASCALCKLVIPGIGGIKTTPLPDKPDHDYKRRVMFGAGVFLVLYLLFNFLSHASMLSNQTVSRSNLAAFDWIRNNTPAGSRFLVITGNFDLFKDWTQEWFPAYTERTSQTTIQGREWLNGEDIVTLLGNFRGIQNCANSTAPVSCIGEQASRAKIQYDYIYIAKVTANVPLRNEPQAIGLVTELKHIDNYMLVYDSNDVTIFERLSSP